AWEICGNAIDENCNGDLTDCPPFGTIIVPAADGEDHEFGSTMLVRAYSPSATMTRVDIQSPDENDVYTLYLYDDGNHNDFDAGDGVWGNTWTVNGPGTGVYYMDLAFGNYPVIENARTFNVVSAGGCIPLQINGSSNDKLDVVFIADQYTAAELPLFATKVDQARNYFVTIAPFDTQQSKMNFYRVDSELNMGCGSSGSWQPNCNATNIYTAASVCPYDKVIVLVDGNFSSWSTLNGFAIVDAQDPIFDWNTVHEFGHSFAGLYPEYIKYLGTGGSASIIVNCDSNASCSKWDTVPGAGCFAGCTYNDWYRSINSGLMRTSGSTDFGPVNINRINDLFNSYN
ncbi:MAG: M64 family metallopeptidase, partial [bacterium]|nr:M64 family metallopeptidase [bacterium]